MMKSIWTGHIRFSLVTIPIRLYNAIETSEDIRFNQIHRGCNGRVGYDKRCKKCNLTLKAEDIVKGYEYEPDRYAVFEEADFQKVKLKSTKVIEIEGFVQVSEIHPMLFESPYYAGPDGEVGAKSYALLCQALAGTGRAGVGKVVLRDREEIVVISPHESGLAVYRLRYPDEIRKITDVPQLDSFGTVDTEQLRLACSLIQSMARPLKDIELKDNYKKALKELIEAKVAGKEIITAEEEPRPPIDIMTALKESIELARDSRKGMMAATGKKGERIGLEQAAAETRPKKKKAG